MSRAPVLEFESITQAGSCLTFLETAEAISSIKVDFQQTSHHLNLLRVHPMQQGHRLFIRFSADTGDAMGMNMLSKGVEYTLAHTILPRFPSARVVSLSGNVCVDKKPAAINWIEGRGRNVIAECILPEQVVKRFIFHYQLHMFQSFLFYLTYKPSLPLSLSSSVLHTTPSTIAELNTTKNLIGSAVAGALGGFNAHAANAVAALFIATGQDAAQIVESSHCLTDISVFVFDFCVDVLISSYISICILYLYISISLSISISTAHRQVLFVSPVHSLVVKLGPLVVEQDSPHSTHVSAHSAVCLLLHQLHILLKVHQLSLRLQI